MFNDNFFFNSCLVLDNVETRFRARHTTEDNMAHAHCMLDTEGYKHSSTICNTYCFSLQLWLHERAFILSYM